MTPKAFPSNTANEIWKHEAGMLHPTNTPDLSGDTTSHKTSVGDRDLQSPPSSTSSFL